MALNDRLKDFLVQHRVEHQVLPHREVFTAQEVAEASHVSGRQLAKVVVVREEGKGHLMAVIPGSRRLDVSALKSLVGARKLSLDTEDEVGHLFPDCELGAMPPFGNLYDLRVYIDASFGREKEFFFQAGNHHEVVRMAYGEYARLVNPVVGELCLHEGEKRPSA